MRLRSFNVVIIDALRFYSPRSFLNTVEVKWGHLCNLHWKRLRTCSYISLLPACVLALSNAVTARAHTTTPTGNQLGEQTPSTIVSAKNAAEMWRSATRAHETSRQFWLLFWRGNIFQRNSSSEDNYLLWFGYVSVRYFLDGNIDRGPALIEDPKDVFIRTIKTTKN